jgi:hypothetical protein
VVLRLCSQDRITRVSVLCCIASRFCLPRPQLAWCSCRTQSIMSTIQTLGKPAEVASTKINCWFALDASCVVSEMWTDTHQALRKPLSSSGTCPTASNDAFSTTHGLFLRFIPSLVGRKGSSNLKSVPTKSHSNISYCHRNK